MMPMNFAGHYNNWWCGPGAYFPGPLGIILTVLFWGLIIYLVVKIVQAFLRPKKTSPPSSMDILEKRYAGGDINENEFKRMKADLE